MRELADNLPEIRMYELGKQVEQFEYQIYRPEYFSEVDFKFASYRMLTFEIYRETIRNQEILRTV